MYCTINDIIANITEDQLISITNDQDNANSVVESIVNDKISEISSYIDGAIRSSYTVPITDADDLKFLKPIATDLVVCALYQRRFILEPLDGMISRRKAAISEIEKIQKGITSLNSGTPETRPGNIRVSSRTKLFDDDTLERF